MPYTSDLARFTLTKVDLQSCIPNEFPKNSFFNSYFYIKVACEGTRSIFNNHTEQKSTAKWQTLWILMALYLGKTPHVIRPPRASQNEKDMYFFVIHENKQPYKHCIYKALCSTCKDNYVKRGLFAFVSIKFRHGGKQRIVQQKRLISLSVFGQLKLTFL